MLRRLTRLGWTCGASLLLLSTHAFGGMIGSGTITGVFSDDVATAGAPQRLSQADIDELDLPVSEGHGTGTYQWGLESIATGGLFLDGVETTLDDILANLPIDDLDTRLTAEFGISGNLLSFTPYSFSDQPKGETFVAGLLEYSNDESLLGTAVPSVSLTMVTTSPDPGFSQTLEVPIVITSVINVFDDQGNLLDVPSADFIHFADHPEFGSFRVFENESTSVEVLVEFNSLDLVGFGAVTDPTVGFVSPSVTGAVPEPSSLALLGMERAPSSESASAPAAKKQAIDEMEQSVRPTPFAVRRTAISVNGFESRREAKSKLHLRNMPRGWFTTP